MKAIAPLTAPPLSQPQLVCFADKTGIRYSFHLQAMDEAPQAPIILQVRFKGIYRTGPQGAPDGRFIHGITQTALSVWCPAALILDLRQLSYYWGDEMEAALGLQGEIKVPFAIVGSRTCLPAIHALVKKMNELKMAPVTVNIFDQLEPAWDHLTRQLNHENAES